MVLAEAMAASLPVIAASSGAIPEVVGSGSASFSPGDWLGLARELATGPLAAPPGTRVQHDPSLVSRYGVGAAAERLAAAYESVLEEPTPR